MAVTDDLRAIGESADRELNAVHDFLEHSKIVWRSFQILVDEGHKISADNVATGTHIAQDGLLRLAPQYTREYLATFTFRQFVSAFEVFLFSGVIRTQLNELRYEHLREWFTAANKAVKLDCPAEDEIDALAEIKAARDILEHNAGVVNGTYRRKAGKKARYEVGDHVELDDAYHLDSWKLIKKVVGAVTSAAVARLSE
jgi:hypothetical protein